MEVILAAREQADTAFIRGVFQGLVVFRWLTLAYATIGVVVSNEYLVHPTVVGLLLGMTFLYTATTTVMFRRAFGLLTHPATIITEFVLGATLLVADGYVYLDQRPQSLPWAWPAASLISSALTFGVRVGVTLALALGIASFIGEGLNSGGGPWGVTASSKTGLYILAAAVTGYVGRRLRLAEQQVSVAQAREEVARTLHDGVLQTLAVVQRRSDDPELAQLAREQDRELRDFLYGHGVEELSLEAAVRDAAARVQRHHRTSVQVVMADDLPELAADQVQAVVGAVGEALTNTAKHADATRTVVYLEPNEDGGVFCSVKDNGRGFDQTTTPEGQGLSQSIRARIDEVGGRVEITAAVDKGTEIQMWVG